MQRIRDVSRAPDELTCISVMKVSAGGPPEAQLDGITRMRWRLTGVAIADVDQEAAAIEQLSQVQTLRGT